MSFYSADALPRAITDLEGVLCAGGVMTLFGRGTAARLAIVLGAPPPVVEVPDGEESDGGFPDVEVPDGGSPGGGSPGGEVPVVAPRERRSPHGQTSGDGPSEGGVAGVAVPEGQGRAADEGRSGGGEGRPDGEWDGVDELPDDEFPVRDEEDCHGGVLDEGPLGAERLGAPAPGVVVPDPVVEWRAHALCCALRGRGVPAEVDRLPDGRPLVRSAYRADLLGLADGWRSEDGGTVVPADLELDGPRLRLWVLAAGRRRGRAYTLGIDPNARMMHEPLLTACQRAGLGANLAGDEDDPVIEIVGQRRMRRLVELVGARPGSLAEGVWPG